MSELWHAMDVESVLKLLKSSKDGLSDAEAELRLKKIWPQFNC